MRLIEFCEIGVFFFVCVFPLSLYDSSDFNWTLSEMTAIFLIHIYIYNFFSFSCFKWATYTFISDTQGDVCIFQPCKLIAIRLLPASTLHTQALASLPSKTRHMKLYIIIMKNLIHDLVLKTSETLCQPYTGMYSSGWRRARVIRCRWTGMGSERSLSEKVIYYGLGWPYKKWLRDIHCYWVFSISERNASEKCFQSFPLLRRRRRQRCIMIIMQNKKRHLWWYA